MMLPIENDLFKIRSDDGINYRYSHQFWKHSVHTGEWSGWLPLELFNEKEKSFEVVGDNADGWFVLLRVLDRFCVFDLRDWQDDS